MKGILCHYFPGTPSFLDFCLSRFSYRYYILIINLKYIQWFWGNYESDRPVTQIKDRGRFLEIKHKRPISCDAKAKLLERNYTVPFGVIKMVCVATNVAASSCIKNNIFSSNWGLPYHIVIEPSTCLFKGAIIFYGIGGGHQKAGGSQFFFSWKIGGS